MNQISTLFKLTVLNDNYIRKETMIGGIDLFNNRSNRMKWSDRFGDKMM
jgi:hypothetical protein